MSHKAGKRNEAQSFWSTAPGILTGVAAVITAIGGLVAVLNAAGFFNALAPHAVPASPVTSVISNDIAQSPSSRVLPTAVLASTSCFDQYFRGIAPDRVATLEEGVQGLQVIGPDQTKNGPIGILFTQNNQPIGGITFQFFLDGQLFKVATVVDAACQTIEDYSNATRTSDKNSYQNYDTIQLRLANQTYQLWFEYNGSIVVSFRKFTP